MARDKYLHSRQFKLTHFRIHASCETARSDDLRRDQRGAEIVDVGAGRAGDKAVVQHREEAVAVIVVQHRCGSRPLARARASVSGVKTAPAISSAPSTPSVSADRPQMPDAPSAAIASASRYSTLRPPR